MNNLFHDLPILCSEDGWIKYNLNMLPDDQQNKRVNAILALFGGAVCVGHTTVVWKYVGEKIIAVRRKNKYWHTIEIKNKNVMDVALQHDNRMATHYPLNL